MRRKGSQQPYTDPPRRVRHIGADRDWMDPGDSRKARVRKDALLRNVNTLTAELSAPRLDRAGFAMMRAVYRRASAFGWFPDGKTALPLCALVNADEGLSALNLALPAYLAVTAVCAAGMGVGPTDLHECLAALGSLFGREDVTRFLPWHLDGQRHAFAHRLPALRQEVLMLLRAAGPDDARVSALGALNGTAQGDFAE